jgi:hypothetical protein
VVKVNREAHEKEEGNRKDPAKGIVRWKGEREKEIKAGNLNTC